MNTSTPGQEFPGKPKQRPAAQNLARSSTTPVGNEPNSGSSFASALFGGIAKLIEVPPQQSVEQVYQEEEEFLERFHP